MERFKNVLAIFSGLSTFAVGLVISTAHTAYGDINVWLGPVQEMTDSTLFITVVVDTIALEDSVNSIEIFITFSSDVFNVITDEITHAITGSFLFFPNTVGNTVKVAFASASPIEGSGEILRIPFKVIDPQGIGNFTIDRFEVNEGGVAVSILTRTVFFPELPTAYSGVDTTVNEGDTLVLDGSASSDPDGDILSYLWIQVSGPSVTLSSDVSQSPTFVAPEVTRREILTFTLVVNDGGLESQPDSVSITVNDVNKPPIANAGVDQRVDEGDRVLLDGFGSSDPDGDILSYLWIQVSGPSVTLSSDTVQSPTFVAPEVVQTLILTFTLVVNDGELESLPDSVRITVNDVNKTPIANAGVDQRVDERDTLILDGSGSSDPDGDVLTYLWSQLSGPMVTLSDRTTQSPTFVAPEVTKTELLTFVLVVNDGELESLPDSVSITVNDVNKPPIANAGVDQRVDEGVRVILDGFGSSDPDGDLLTYLWSQVSGPVVTLSDRTTQSPTFIVPDVAETLVLTFTLVVSDGQADSQAHSVRIVVKNVPEIIGDFNEDDEVGLADFVLFLDAFGSSLGGTAFDEKFDLDGDDKVELSDFVVFLDHFGERR